MATPVSEQIAVVVRSRLAAISTTAGYETTTSGAIRPTKQGGFQPKDYQIIVSKVSNARVNIYPGNPAKIERNLQFNIRAIVRPSDADPTAIDTLVDTFAADVTKALTNVANWHSFGGLAINAVTDETADYETDGEGAAGYMSTTLNVIYRHPENDPYTVSA